MLRAQDIMNSDFLTVPSSMTIGELTDLFQRAHIHAAPVVDDHGDLVGIVTQEDILYGTMGGDQEAEPASRIHSRSGMLELDDLERMSEDSPGLWARPVSDIMTHPAITVQPETELREVCRVMWSVRIHHVPVTNAGTIVGLISSLDLCRAVAEGKLPT